MYDQAEVLPALVAFVDQMLRFAGFALGSQQDAAECLMYLFQCVDGGDMQRFAWGSYAAASVENMVLCRIDADCTFIQYHVSC